MSTCTHCNQRFAPKYKSMKLCFECWKKRETAFEDYEDLLLELQELRNFAKPGWQVEIIPAQKIRQLLSLTHPDRHHNTPREKTATEITKWLNELKRKA